MEFDKSATVRSGGKAETQPSCSNHLMGISFLAALSLVIVVGASQPPMPLASFDSLAQQTEAKQGTVPCGESPAGFRFQSCSGGGSVNCHPSSYRPGQRKERS